MKIAGLAVLALEDEPIIALALEDMLADAGAVPIGACSLKEAEQALEQGGVDCAILDVNVHHVSSYGLARALARRGIPFVFATGYGNSPHPREFAHIPTIAKPYTMADIDRAFASLSAE